MSENTRVLTPPAPHTTENNEIHRLTPLAPFSSNARLFNLDFLAWRKICAKFNCQSVYYTRNWPKKHAEEKNVEFTQFF